MIYGIYRESSVVCEEVVRWIVSRGRMVRLEMIWDRLSFFLLGSSDSVGLAIMLQLHNITVLKTI